MRGGALSGWAAVLLAATTTAAVAQSADLSIYKEDGLISVTPGGSTTYTIVVTNAGPDAVAGATVTDLLPPSMSGTWNCVGSGGGTCTASGTGDINDTVNLPVGGSATYTLSAAISPSATGVITNTASVTSPLSDPNPGNNSATDTDLLAPVADLSIAKTNGVATVAAGATVTYTITASNAGPSDALGAIVQDNLPAPLTGTWTCVGAGGGTCTAAGTGNINDTVNLPAGGSVIYTVTASVSGSATGVVVNTATVAAPGGVSDPDLSNNSATDTDTVVAAPAAPNAIPTLSQWALWLLGGLLVVAVSRKRGLFR